MGTSGIQVKTSLFKWYH